MSGDSGPGSWDLGQLALFPEKSLYYAGNPAARFWFRPYARCLFWRERCRIQGKESSSHHSSLSTTVSMVPRASYRELLDEM
jgi:hypothetical protein